MVKLGTATKYDRKKNTAYKAADIATAEAALADPNANTLNSPLSKPPILLALGVGGAEIKMFGWIIQPEFSYSVVFAFPFSKLIRTGPEGFPSS